MTYDLETIRAAVAKATPGEWETYSEPDVSMPATLMVVTRAESEVFPTRNVLEPLSCDDIWAVSLLMNAARNGLLEDAAIGRAVRAAADRDGPEREAVMNDLCATADANFDIRFDYALAPGYAQAAAQAIINFVKEKSGE